MGLFKFPWEEQFSYEPLDVYQQKERERAVGLVTQAFESKYPDGPPPIPGASGPGLGDGFKIQDIAGGLKNLLKPLSFLAGTPGVIRDPQAMPGGQGPDASLANYTKPTSHSWFDKLGDVAGGVGDFAQRVTEIPGELASDPRGSLAAGGMQALGGVGTAFDATAKYAGRPAMGILTGAAGMEQDANGARGGYGGDVLGYLKGVGEGIAHPGRAGQAWQGFREGLTEAQLAGHDIPGPVAEALQIGGQTVEQPLNWLSVGHTAEGAGLGTRFLRGAILDQGGMKLALGANAGATIAARHGDSIPGLNRVPEELRPLVGGAAGALAPAAGAKAFSMAKNAKLPSLEGLAGEAPVMGATNAGEFSAQQVGGGLPTDPNRAGLGPLPPSTTRLTTALDQKLQQYRGPDGKLNMTGDDVKRVWDEVNGAKAPYPGVRPLGLNDIRYGVQKGLAGANWYREFAGFLNELTGGKLNEALQSFAVTSARTPPAENLMKTFSAMKVYNDLTDGGRLALDPAQFAQEMGKQGMTIPKLGRIPEQQANKISESYLTGVSGTGGGAAKTPSYNQNLRDAFFGRYSPFTTADTHHLAPFDMGAEVANPGFGAARRADTPEVYAFVDRLTQHLASEQGLQPMQVQAALWDTVKKVKEADGGKWAKGFDDGTLTWQEAVDGATRSGHVSTGGFEESFHNDPRVQAAYRDLMDSFAAHPPTSTRSDFTYNYNGSGMKGAQFNASEYRVNPEVGAQAREAVNAQSPVVNVSAKPNFVGREAQLGDLRGEQLDAMKQIGYDEATNQFKPLADAGIPHEVVQRAGTWNGAEPNTRIILSGANADKAEFVAGWLGKKLDEIGRPQDAIAVELPGSQTKTIRALDLRKPDGSAWTDAEMQALDDAAFQQHVDHGFRQLTDDPSTVRFSDYGGDDPAAFHDAITNFIHTTGHDPANLYSTAEDSFLVEGNYDAAIAKHAHVYDPNGILSGGADANAVGATGSYASAADAAGAHPGAGVGEGGAGVPSPDAAGYTGTPGAASSPSGGLLDRLKSTLAGEGEAAGITPKREAQAAREAGGNTVRRMRGDEIGNALGKDAAEVAAYREASDMIDAGTATPEVKAAREAIRKEWTQEYVDQFGRQPVHVFQPGAGAEKYATIDARTQALRDKGYSEQEIQALGLGDNGMKNSESYVGPANYERRMQLEKMAGDTSLSPELRARAREKLNEEAGVTPRMPEDVGQFAPSNYTGETGSAAEGPGLADVGKVARDSFVGKPTVINTVARAGAGFASAKLEGDSNTDAAARAMVAAMPASVAKAAFSAADHTNSILKNADDAIALGFNPLARKTGEESGQFLAKTVEGVHQLSRVMFTTATSGDFGSAMIQSAYMAVLHPVEWAKSLPVSMHAAFDPAYRDAIRLKHEAMLNSIEPGAYQKLLDNGLQLSKQPKPGAVAKPTSDLSSLLEKAPVVGVYFRGGRRQFEVQTEALRAKAAADMLKLEKVRAGGAALPDDVIKHVANLANHLTGASNISMGPLAGVAFGAPRFLASQFALLMDASKMGASENYIRKQLLASFGTVSTVVALANAFESGGKDWFGPGLGGPQDIKDWSDLKKVLTSPNFGKVRVGDADISAYGPLESLFRTAMRETVAVADRLQDNPGTAEPGKATLNFLRGKASPLATSVMNAIEGGNNFTGEKYSNFTDWLADNGQKAMPIFAQSIKAATEGKGSYVDAVAGAFGLRSSPTTPRERADAILESVPQDFWVTDAETKLKRPPQNLHELTPSQQQQLRKVEPDVETYLSGLEQSGNKTPVQKLKTEFTAAQTYWDTQLESSKLTKDAWRTQFGANGKQLRILRDQLQAKKEWPAATTQEGQDLEKLFAVYGDSKTADGSLDMDTVDEKLNALRVTIGNSRWKTLQSTLGWDKSPTVSGYLKDMQIYRDVLSSVPKYYGLEPGKETRQADKAAGLVRQVMAANPTMTSRQAILELQDLNLLSDDEANGARVALKAKYTTDYNEWRSTADGRRVLEWFKPVLADTPRIDRFQEGPTSRLGGGGASGSSYADSFLGKHTRSKAL